MKTKECHQWKSSQWSPTAIALNCFMGIMLDLWNKRKNEVSWKNICQTEWAARRSISSILIIKVWFSPIYRAFPPIYISCYICYICNQKEIYIMFIMTAHWFPWTCTGKHLLSQSPPQFGPSELWCWGYFFLFTQLAMSSLWV